MSARLKALIDDQQTIWKRMQDTEAAVEKDGWTGELRKAWDDDEARLTEVSADIERMERKKKLDEVDYRDAIDPRVPEDERTKPTDEERQKAYDEAFWAYVRNGMSELPGEQQRLLRTGFVKNEERAQGVGTPSAGGYLVPEGFLNKITSSQKAFGGLMNVANVITTTTGNPLPWPTNDDTGNAGALLSENTQIGEQDLTIGEEELGAYTYTSKLVRVSWALLNDEAFGLESFLGTKLGERIGRAQAPHLVSGTGTNQPTGLVAAATAGVTGAVAAQAAITYDNLIDLEHSVDPAYRNGGRCRYALSDGELKLIRKLKDADGRPLWVPVPAPGFPPTINGFEYTVDNSMAAPAPGARSLIFGDIYAGFVVRVVAGIQMVRLNERYADYLQTGFFAFSRMDSTPDDTAAVKAFVHGPAA